MRDEIELSDDAIEESFSALGIGITIDDLVFTRETIDDFLSARSHYAIPGKVSEHSATSFVVFDAQPRKGDRRRDVYVVDFGAVRAVATS